MATSVVLLRGINVGPNNRIAMPALRDALLAAGFENPRTYLQSGNIVLRSRLGQSELSDTVRALITQSFGLDVPVVIRSGEELVRVVAVNPFPELAAREPKRFQVTLLCGDLADGTAERLAGLTTEDERVAVQGREIYAWHPDGIARSKLALKLGAKGGLGKDVIATSRNWTTLQALVEMAVGDGG